MFDDKFIEDLPEGNWEALEKIRNRFRSRDQVLRGLTNNFGEYVQAYAFLNVFLEKVMFKGKIAQLDTKESKKNQILMIQSVFFDPQETNFKELEIDLYNDSVAQFAKRLGTSFAYEFSEGDLNKVQTNINELRDLISDSEIIEDNHKQRLLKRLERLQSELHKKMSDLDRFWGFVGDAGVVMGKLGKDAKPFTDRIKDVMSIVWRTQARAEELESGAPNPFLKKNNDEGE
jgi:hypothetical protein